MTHPCKAGIFAVVFFLLALNSAIAASLSETLSFKDGEGGAWERSILQENRDNGRVLLIAVDHKIGASGLLPKVAFRKSFAAGENPQLQAALATLRRPTRAQIKSPGLELKDLVKTANPLWPVENAWTMELETDFNKWIHDNITEDYMFGGGVDVDCADWAMLLRWIYAHDHHLPMANSLTSGGLFVSWESTVTWDALATDPDWRKDERFKAALRYLLTNSYTHTLLGDLYPVEIKPELVSSGTIYLTLWQQSGHTRTIINIGKHQSCLDDSPCILVVYGDEPASERGWTTTLIPNHVNKGEGGFLRWRWPAKAADGKWELTAADKMPGYSLEQFSWSDDDFFSTMSARLNLWNTTQERYLRAGQSAAKAVVDRVTTVERGYFLCSIVPCKKGDAAYEEWSTPQRDHQMLAAINNFQGTGRYVDSSDPVAVAFKAQFDRPIFAGAPLTVISALLDGTANDFSSDPTSDIYTRWAIANPTETDKLQVLGQVAFDNWKWREELVAAAQTLCFPSGATVPKCDPTAKAVKKLSTARLDDAFRKAQGMFAASFAAQPQDVQAAIQTALSAKFTETKFCPVAGSSETRCSLFELLLAHPEHIQKMASEATAGAAARAGF